MSAEEIWKTEIESLPVMEVGKEAIAYPGGLDSSFGIEFLRRKYRDGEVVAITADVGLLRPAGPTST